MRDYCFRTLVGAMAVAAIACLSTPVSASLPTLLWQGATSVRVQCLVAPGENAAAQPLQRSLCDRIVKLASVGAPLPVSTVAFGDPEVIAPGTVALLVHGSIEREGAGHLLAFSIRPYRNSADQSGLLFGAPPRAATLSASGKITPALDAAIGAALRDTLPWHRQRQAGPLTTEL